MRSFWTLVPLHGLSWEPKLLETAMRSELEELESVKTPMKLDDHFIYMQKKF